MINYTITKENSRLLLEKQRFEIKKDHYIEIYQNRITLNRKGIITEINKIILEFDTTDKKNTHQIEMLQEELCEYFNLDPHEIIYQRMTNEDIIFKINFTPKKELFIVVCDKRQAIKNSSELCEDIFLFGEYRNSNQIGPYRQIGKSFYYFRWLPNDDFE